jgi:ribosomal protein S12 methylthiotransferase accessory factor
MIWATAEELGDEAIPADQWPHCSAAELADPRCSLVAPDKHAPMRWVQGWSLTRRRLVYVPSVLVWLKNPPQSRAERFTHSVSTGCSVHTDPVAAVVGGLMEIVERDALTLMWLHRMRLPRLVFDNESIGQQHREAVRRGQVPHLETQIFDATTDLGIPVLYGIQLAEHDRHLSQLVAATCDADAGRAIAKLYREMASVRVALRTMASGERAFADEAISVVAGALAMGGKEKRQRFDFLLDGPRPQRRIEDLPAPPGTQPPVVLNWLLDRLHPAGCEVIVVDITTDEAIQVGATAVRVLVPQLMPLSFDRHGRYLAHPRLWRAPAAMGHPCLAEDALNPDPQPFA